MKKAYQKDKTLARGVNVYIGMDVHKESWHVSACVSGEEVFRDSAGTNYAMWKCSCKDVSSQLIPFKWKSEKNKSLDNSD